MTPSLRKGDAPMKTVFNAMMMDMMMCKLMCVRTLSHTQSGSSSVVSR